MLIRGLGVPTRVFGVDEQIDGVRERRYPTSVDLLGVPAAMIVVQVCTEDDVDRLGLRADRGEALEVGRLEIVEHRSVSLCARVAVARVDEHGESVDADDP